MTAREPYIVLIFNDLKLTVYMERGGGGVAPEQERKKGGNITSSVQCCLYIYGAGRNEFDAGKSISRAVGKGWGP
jgi:hypothetical protein